MGVSAALIWRPRDAGSSPGVKVPTLMTTNPQEARRGRDRNDDHFATAVYRTLRAAHPQALTRSRSVSSLAAPAFAGAMMGRQILGAIPVERRVLIFAALHVAGHPRLEGRTVAEAFAPGAWRVIALDTAEPEDRQRDLAAAPRYGEATRQPALVWEPRPDYVLRSQDRVVLAVTRQGLGELLAGHPLADIHGSQGADR